MFQCSRTVAILLLFFGSTFANAQQSVLFIGNSFTFGFGSPVRFFHPETVTDLNAQDIGGVPALFKAFTVQTGLAFDVYLETQPGSGLDWHLANKRSQLESQAWDVVVMHGHSLLDPEKPRDSTKLVNGTVEMAAVLAKRNPAVDIYLTATWSRADQVFPAAGAWAGKPIASMATDIRAAYDLAASKASRIKAVNPVGEAWNRAMQTGVADANPYDGIGFGQLNLWTYDHYHASSFGYYLEALIVFGSVTGRDPRSLGANECAAFELGISAQQASALQQVAFAELSEKGRVKDSVTPATSDAKPQTACSFNQ